MTGESKNLISESERIPLKLAGTTDSHYRYDVVEANQIKGDGEHLQLDGASGEFEDETLLDNDINDGTRRASWQTVKIFLALTCKAILL